jgi:CubicO group peptidase (beta-lactamase class C family)
MRQLLSAIVLLVLLSPQASTAPPLLVAPADAGMSADKLAEGVALFRAAIDKDELRNVILLVARDGQLVLHEPLGWKNVEAEQAMQTDVLLRMASNTKAVVATAVLMLAEERKLRLDDPIGRHLPAFDNQQYRHVTIRQLLSHTSGLRISTLFREPLMEASDEYPDAPSLQLEVNRFAEIGPEVKPGSSFRYNNAGYNTLGALIEVVSGLPLEEFLEQRIYQPLNMTDTSHRPKQETAERMSVVYASKDGEWSIRFKQGTEMRVPFVRASGGLVSTTTDYLRFLQMHLDEGVYQGQRLLSRRSVRLAQKNHTIDTYTKEQQATRTSYYGLGWFLNTDGSYWHSGSEGTYTWVDPQRRVIGMVMSQSPGGKYMRNEFRAIVNAACLDR